MKVLIACNKDTYPNPFVWTLADGISSQGVDVVCSISDFWNNWQQYDIIHLQWPPILLKGYGTIDTLSNHLKMLEAAGIPIVTTCHNFRSHYSKNTIAEEAYDIVYQYTDCFIHLGSYSCEEFKKTYPEKKHVIIPHHIYDSQYKSIPTREESVKHLKLNTQKKYILCFGAFRDDEERNLVNIIAKRMAPYGVEVLAPGFSRVMLRKNLYKLLKSYYHYIINKIKYNRIYFSSAFVPDDELPYYYGASDIALIQRKQILNSGNLPMAFMMGKVVVGPNVGNVGTILHETGNPTFDVNDLSTLVSATKEGIHLSETGKGNMNMEYAYNHYTTEIVARQHCDLYKELFLDSLNKSNHL